MVSINGLPPPSRSNKISRPRRSSKPEASSDQAKQIHRPTAVASAVSKSLHSIDESQLNDNHIHYDGPEAKSRKALQEYYAVLNQAKRDELTQMLGVDIYI